MNQNVPNEPSLTAMQRLHCISVCATLARGENILLLGFRDGYAALILEKVAASMNVLATDPDHVAKARAIFGETDRLAYELRSPQEQFPIDDQSIGLVLIDEAMPCQIDAFDLMEIQRVLRPSGILASVHRSNDETLPTYRDLLLRTFQHVSPSLLTTVTASVLLNPDAAAQNTDTYRGYTYRTKPEGHEIGPGLLRPTQGPIQFILCSDKPLPNPHDNNSIFCINNDGHTQKPIPPRSEPASWEDIRTLDPVSAQAIATALSKITNSRTAATAPDILAALSTLTEHEKRQSQRLAELDELLRNLQQRQTELQQEVARLKRQESSIRSETDTAIAQRIAQTRRYKKLRTLAIEGSHHIRTLAQERDHADLMIERSANTTTTLLGPTIRRLAHQVAPSSLGSKRASNDTLLNRLAGRTTSALVAKGDTCNRQKDWKNAASYYAAALLRDWQLAPIWTQFAHALKEQGLLDDAEIAYRQASIIDLNDTDALIHLGHLLLRLDRVASARRAFSQVLERDQSNSEAILALNTFKHAHITSGLMDLANNLEREARNME